MPVIDVGVVAVTAGEGVAKPAGSNHLLLLMLADFWCTASDGSPPVAPEWLDEAEGTSFCSAEDDLVGAGEVAVVIGSEAKAFTKRMPWCLDLEMRSPLRVETKAPLWTVALKWSIGRRPEAGPIGAVSYLQCL